MQEKLLSSCRGRGGDRHDSEFAVEGLVKEGLLQFLQGGEFAFVGASEVLGVYAQVVGGLLAVFNAGIAQQAGESAGQQKLSGLMQDSHCLGDGLAGKGFWIQRSSSPARGNYCRMQAPWVGSGE